MRKASREQYEKTIAAQEENLRKLRYDLHAAVQAKETAEGVAQTAERRFEIVNSQLERAIGKLELLLPLHQKIFGVPSADRPSELRNTERRF